MGRVSKFLDPYSPQPGKTNLVSCLFPPAFLEIGLFKKKSMYAAFFSQTLSFLGASGLWMLFFQSLLPHVSHVPRGGEPGRKAGRTTAGKVTRALSGLSRFWPSSEERPMGWRQPWVGADSRRCMLWHAEHLPHLSTWGSQVESTRKGEAGDQAGSPRSHCVLLSAASVHHPSPLFCAFLIIHILF